MLTDDVCRACGAEDNCINAEVLLGDTLLKTFFFYDKRFWKCSASTELYSCSAKPNTIFYLIFACLPALSMILNPILFWLKARAARMALHCAPADAALRAHARPAGDRLPQLPAPGAQG
jgi:hypothetical protein